MKLLKHNGKNEFQTNVNYKKTSDNDIITYMISTPTHKTQLQKNKNKANKCCQITTENQGGSLMQTLIAVKKYLQLIHMKEA